MLSLFGHSCLASTLAVSPPPGRRGLPEPTFELAVQLANRLQNKRYVFLVVLSLPSGEDGRPATIHGRSNLCLSTQQLPCHRAGQGRRHRQRPAPSVCAEVVPDHSMSSAKRQRRAAGTGARAEGRNSKGRAARWSTKSLSRNCNGHSPGYNRRSRPLTVQKILLFGFPGVLPPPPDPPGWGAAAPHNPRGEVWGAAAPQPGGGPGGREPPPGSQTCKKYRER